MTITAAGQPIQPTLLRRRAGRKDPTYFWFLLPAILVLGTLSLIPLLVTFYLSLQKMNLMYPTDIGFGGLANYQRMVADQYFWMSVRTTLILIAAPVAVQMVLGLLLALLLHNDAPLMRISRSLFIAPMVIPPVVAGLVWKVLFIPNLGGLNFFLGLIGIPGPLWLETPGWAIASVTVVAVWQDTPFVMLLVLAALESMPQEPIEAATVDGASGVQLFRYVTFPYLIPTLTVALLFRIINSLAIFPVIYVLTQGGPGRATEMLNYYTFVNAFQYLDIGYASALALALFALVVILSLLFMRLRVRALEMVE